MLNGLAAADASFQQAMAGAGLIEAYLTECHARYTAAEAAVEARHRAMIEALTISGDPVSCIAELKRLIDLEMEGSVG